VTGHKAQTEPIVFVNGRQVPPDGAHVSARDRGLTLADGLFETMRARGGVVFRLDRHLSRLFDGLRVMGIPEPSALKQTVAQAVSAAGAADQSIRLTVTRGPGPGGLTPPLNPTPTVIVVVNPMPSFPGTIYTSGLRAIISSGRRNTRSLSVGLKTLAYTDAVLAWVEAQRSGADDAILLDEDGHCSEATASNLFMYRDNVLLTPPLTCAALPGITRASVLELAAVAGVRTAERAFDPSELSLAQEAFLTSSLRGVAPVSSLDGRPIGNGNVGPVTTRLIAAYKALVDLECSTT
jgi:branched-chain amino acid aminotransferase